MRSKSLFIIWIAIALFLLAGFSYIWLVPYYRARQLIRQSEPIQTSLEIYRQQYGRYPDSLSTIGIIEREEGTIYYRRESDKTYILWFGTSLGESTTFYSIDRSWH